MKKISKYIDNFLYFFWMYLYIYFIFLYQNGIIANRYMLLFLFPFILLKIKKSYLKSIFKDIRVYIFLFLFISIINLIIEKNVKLIFDYFYFLFSIILAVRISKNSEKTLLFSKILIFISILWFFINGINYGFSIYDYNNFFLKSAKNMVASIFFYFSLLYYTSYINRNINTNNLKLSFFPVMLTLAVSTLTSSRTLILLSFIFLMIITYNNIMIKKNTKNIIIFIILLIAIFISFNFVFEFYYENTDFKTEGFSTPRFMIIESYIKTINIKNFFFGIDLSDIKIINLYNGNPHNSFIKLHSNYGIIGIIFIFGVTYKYIKKIKKYKFLYISFLFLFLLRASTDIISFNGEFDYIYFYILISYSFNNKNKSDINILGEK